ncbi:MAG: hypothetical protein ABIS14_07660 [Sphingomonas sp.]
MSNSNDREYYEARAEAARALSSNATDPGIAKIHGEMADRYELLAEAATPAAMRPKLHVSTG